MRTRHICGGVLDGTIGDDFLDIVSQNELIGLSWYDAGARNFYNSKKPITCLEDMQGMRIRVQESEVMADMIEALWGIRDPDSVRRCVFCLGAGNSRRSGKQLAFL